MNHRCTDCEQYMPGKSNEYCKSSECFELTFATVWCWRPKGTLLIWDEILL